MSVDPVTTGNSRNNLSISISQEMERSELVLLQGMEQELMEELQHRGKQVHRLEELIKVLKEAIAILSANSPSSTSSIHANTAVAGSTPSSTK